jgi:hypothetical protein
MTRYRHLTRESRYWERLLWLRIARIDVLLARAAQLRERRRKRRSDILPHV